MHVSVVQALNSHVFWAGQLASSASAAARGTSEPLNGRGSQYPVAPIHELRRWKDACSPHTHADQWQNTKSVTTTCTSPSSA